MEQTNFISNLLEQVSTNLVFFMLVILVLIGFFTFAILTIRPQWAKQLLHQKRPILSLIIAVWLLASLICTIITLMALLSDVITRMPT